MNKLKFKNAEGKVKLVPFAACKAAVEQGVPTSRQVTMRLAQAGFVRCGRRQQ